ncbi:putative 5-Methylcytosine G/T mismatch-specific DNA glycosylase, partial [Eremomyces bilateralis CBS 781.70]
PSTPPVAPKNGKETASVPSTLPFPPLSSNGLGLIQETLAHHPFQLLVAVTLLNKTRGSVAIPVFHALMNQFPDPEQLSHASVEEVESMIGTLGLQRVRAKGLVSMAKLWLENPPTKGVRYGKRGYPVAAKSFDSLSKGPRRTPLVRDGEVIDDEVVGGRINCAWEIAHLPCVGAYALDSWRIFCRDELRGVATGYNGEGQVDDGDVTVPFEPEWMRVQPTDKELRAFVRWMWLKEGWIWNPETGEREVAGQELLERAERG